ncbi:hypothetical protein KY342_05065 [Candidatus Woesearchaeota archaeon]|nr:hypothetical protein [Candidatus Woesearchaeota archaeon]
MARVKRTEKKIWFPIVAPKIFYNQVVGQILLTNPSDAIGRIVPVNLANLTRDPRRQNITIKLKASNVAGEKIHTELIGYKISPSFVKKLVRKGGTKIDYSFTAYTADNKNLRIKTTLLARKEIKTSVSTALKKTVEDILKKEIKKMSFVEIMQAIVTYKIQSGMKKQLAKVYPLKVFEIRHLGIEKIKKTEEEKPLKVEEKKAEEKPAKEEVKEKKTEEKTEKKEVKEIPEKPSKETEKSEEKKE